MVRDAVLGLGLLLSFVALGLALRGDEPKEAPAVAASPSGGELRNLQNTVERQARRISTLEAQVGDLQDTVAALREKTGLPAPVAAAPVPVVPPTPAEEPVAARVSPTLPDGGVDPVVRQAVATALKEEREKQGREFRERFLARQVERLDNELSLTEEQRKQIQTLLQDMEARREEAQARLANAPDQRAARREVNAEIRSAYDARMKELLTPKQQEAYAGMGERERGPPGFGPGPGRWGP